MSRRYYWLKLKKDFFKRHDIRIVESMPNGKDYILFYLKLLCESVDHEGNLRFSDRVPYNEEMLATITNTNIDIVRKAVEIFTELEMMEMLDDGTIFMTEVSGMMGCETEWAEKKRLYRDKQKTLEAPSEEPNKDIVLTMSDKRKSKSKSKSKNNRVSKDTLCQISDSFNAICVSYPRVTRLTDKREQKISARLDTFTDAEILQAFRKAEESDFLTGRSGKWKGASFDWIFDSDDHMLKILEGQYDNKQKQDKYEAARQKIHSIMEGAT